MVALEPQIRAYRWHMDPISVDVKAGSLLMFLARGPETYRKTCIQALNDMAFAFKAQAPKEIAKDHIVRNKRFVESRFRVDKANGNMDSLQSSAYSIASDRFSGWADEYGGEPERDRVFGMAARGGDKKNQAEKGARTGQPFTTASEFEPSLRMSAIISIIARDSTKGARPFILPGSQGWAPGVYRIKKEHVKTIRNNALRAKARAHDSLTWAPPIEIIQRLHKKPTRQNSKRDWREAADKAVAKLLDRIWQEAFRKVT